MTNSPEKVNLFQICSEFLFPFTKSSKLGNSETIKLDSFLNIQNEIFQGEVDKEEVESFFGLWHTLITDPDVFPDSASTPISTFISQEPAVMLTDSMIKAVISAHLGLENQPDELATLMEKGIKIFHEDHPGSYILAYRGKRLGMFTFSICQKDNRNYRVSYRFDPSITSFH